MPCICRTLVIVALLTMDCAHRRGRRRRRPRAPAERAAAQRHHARRSRHSPRALCPSASAIGHLTHAHTHDHTHSRHAAPCRATHRQGSLSHNQRGIASADRAARPESAVCRMQATDSDSIHRGGTTALSHRVLQVQLLRHSHCAKVLDEAVACCWR